MIVYSGISTRLLCRVCAGGLSVTQILNVQIYGFFPGHGICFLFFSTLPLAYPRILPIAWSISYFYKFYKSHKPYNYIIIRSPATRTVAGL